MEKDFKRDVLLPTALSFLSFVILFVLKKKGMWEFSGYFAGTLFLLSPIFLEKSDEVIGLKIKWKELIKFSIISFSFFAVLFVVLLFFHSFIDGKILNEKLKFLNIRFSPRIPEISDIKIFFIMLFGVALPEEIFFRGLVQGRFNRYFGKKMKFFGVEIGLGLFLANVLFTLVHIAYSTEIIRFLVFFPGLIFGFLREKYESIFPSVVLHTWSNIFMILITSG